MTNEDFKKMAEELNRSQAIVIGAKIIADAIDRYTEIQKKNIEIQIKMSGMATDVFKKITDQMENPEDGEDWKKN